MIGRISKGIRVASVIAGGELRASASTKPNHGVRRSVLIAAIAVFLIVILAIAFGRSRTGRIQQPVPVSQEDATGTTTSPLAKLASGPETYAISQRASVLPRIVQATIDPPDVHIGNTQKLTLVVQDPAAITSVEAQIETDHGTKVLPLKLVGPVAEADLAPAPWIVDSSDHLVVNYGGGSSPLAAPANIAYAADAPQLRYEATWIVADTHDTKYHTTFVVKDAAGRKNSITLAWSDACGIPNGGDWNLATNGNCTIAETDGVDNGTATIAAYTLTIQSGVTFAWNPGFSVIIGNGGAIAIGAGAQLKKTYLWMIDNDNDGYPSGVQYAQASPPAPGPNPNGNVARRYTFSNPADCDDTNSHVYQLKDVIRDADHDRYGTGIRAPECVGDVVADGCPDENGNFPSGQNWWYVDDTGAHSWLDYSYYLGTDSNDASCNIH